MEIDLSKEKISEVYLQDGNSYYYDPIREKMILVQAEETVRQRVVSYLINKLAVPENMINVEVPLVHHIENETTRADITIEALDGDETKVLAVVECKAENICLGATEEEQLDGYCTKLHAKYGLLVNGKIALSYIYNDDQKLEIDKLPTYSEMLDNKYTIRVKPKHKRILFSEAEQYINDNLMPDSRKTRKVNGGEEYIYYKEEDGTFEPAYYISPFGTVNEKLIPLLFREAFLDDSVKLHDFCGNYFKLVKDLGVTLRDFKNPSGNSNYFGKYRTLLVEHNGDVNIVCLGVNQYSPENTIICVGVESSHAIMKNGKMYTSVERHFALQYNVQINLSSFFNIIDFPHNCDINGGSLGKVKRMTFIKYLKEKAPELLFDHTVDLGGLEITGDLDMENEDFLFVLSKMVDYAMVIDDFKRWYKNYSKEYGKPEDVPISKDYKKGDIVYLIKTIGTSEDYIPVFSTADVLSKKGKLVKLQFLKDDKDVVEFELDKAFVEPLLFLNELE